MKNKKVLFCDIDDVLIKSSPFIQEYVNNNTIFKTEMLVTIEQLIRNCKYYVNKVEEECDNSLKENRRPNLSKFPNLDINFDKLNYDYANYDEKYLICNNIKNAARYYLVIANSILNQFLEERDMFLELDNLPKGEGKKYNFEKEKINIDNFKNTLRNNYNALDLINKFCLSEVQRISANSRLNGTFPDYGALVKMDSNDIIRTNDNNEDGDYYLYDKPCLDVYKCISNRIVDYAIDNFNITPSKSSEIVNYHSFYIPKYALKSAVLALRKIMLKGEIDELCFITHHNGIREEDAKRLFVKLLFPNASFLGLRFHSEEHDIIRRKRSSKFEKAIKEYNLNPEDMILLDDSIDNCNDWEKNGGKAIIYREITDAEKTSEVKEFPYPRIISFDFLDEAISSVLKKNKVKEKVIK